MLSSCFIRGPQIHLYDWYAYHCMRITIAFMNIALLTGNLSFNHYSLYTQCERKWSSEGTQVHIICRNTVDLVFSLIIASLCMLFIYMRRDGMCNLMITFIMSYLIIFFRWKKKQNKFNSHWMISTFFFFFNQTTWTNWIDTIYWIKIQVTSEMICS